MGIDGVQLAVSEGHQTVDLPPYEAEEPHVSRPMWRVVADDVLNFTSKKKNGLIVTCTGITGLATATYYYHTAETLEQQTTAKGCMWASSSVLGFGVQMLIGATPSNVKKTSRELKTITGAPDLEISSAPERTSADDDSDKSTPPKGHSPEKAGTPENISQDGSPTLKSVDAKDLEAAVQKMEVIPLEDSPRTSEGSTISQKSLGDHWNTLKTTIRVIQDRSFRENAIATGETLQEFAHYLQTKQAILIHFTIGGLLTYPELHLGVSCVAMVSLGMWSFNLRGKVIEAIRNRGEEAKNLIQPLGHVKNAGSQALRFVRKYPHSLVFMSLGAAGLGATYGSAVVISKLAEAELLNFVRTVSMLFCARPVGTASCSLVNRVKVYINSRRIDSLESKVITGLAFASRTQVLSYVTGIFLFKHPTYEFIPVIGGGAIGFGLGSRDYECANSVRDLTDELALPPGRLSLNEFKELNTSQKVAYLVEHYWQTFVMVSIGVQGLIVPDSWVMAIVAGSALTSYYTSRLSSKKSRDLLARLETDLMILGATTIIAAPVLAVKSAGIALTSTGLGLIQRKVNDSEQEAEFHHGF